MPSDEWVRWSEARRKERRSRRLAQYRAGLRPLAVAVWQLSKEHNLGSLVRTAHAVGAEEVLLVGGLDWNAYAARTADQLTTVLQLPDAGALLARAADCRWNLVAVELHQSAVSMFDAEYPERPCFLLGSELGGLPEDLRRAACLTVQIPQWGLVPSLNVAVAGSLVLYDHLAKLHRRGELDRPSGGLPVGPDGE